jgi:hypothetical protein
VQNLTQLPFPKWELSKNKSKRSGVFFATQKPPSTHHNPPRFHHKFTSKTPHENTRFSQNPLQKRQMPAAKKGSTPLAKTRCPRTVNHLRIFAQGTHPFMVHKIRQPAVIAFHRIIKPLGTIFVQTRV